MRYYETHTLAIAEGDALSDILDVRRVSEVWLLMPAEWTAASLGIKTSPTLAGTFVPLCDTAGDRVVFTVQVDGVQVAPVSLAGAGFIKLWSNTAGVDEAQVAARSFTVILRAEV
jgi:hypothetical protein